jgi:hypothetical protein
LSSSPLHAKSATVIKTATPAPTRLGKDIRRILPSCFAGALDTSTMTQTVY